MGTAIVFYRYLSVACPKDPGTLPQVTSVKDKQMPKRRAFTLVELLVVIGIISLLIGILLPALNKARESARQVQCLSNMRQISVAIISFANEHNGLMPGAAGSTLTLDRALRNVVALGISLPDAVRMLTTNPAKLLGIEFKKGALRTGADARLTLPHADDQQTVPVPAGLLPH